MSGTFLGLSFFAIFTACMVLCRIALGSYTCSAKRVFFFFVLIVLLSHTNFKPRNSACVNLPGLYEINCSSSSVRGMARLLGMHHRNVTAALSQRSRMCESESSLWRLSVRKKSTDGVLPPSTRNLVVQWWVEATWVSRLTKLKWPEREWF